MSHSSKPAQHGAAKPSKGPKGLHTKPVPPRGSSSHFSPTKYPDEALRSAQRKCRNPASRPSQLTQVTRFPTFGSDEEDDDNAIMADLEDVDLSSPTTANSSGGFSNPTRSGGSSSSRNSSSKTNTHPRRNKPSTPKEFRPVDARFLPTSSPLDRLRKLRVGGDDNQGQKPPSSARKAGHAKRAGITAYALSENHPGWTGLDRMRGYRAGRVEARVRTLVPAENADMARGFAPASACSAEIFNSWDDMEEHDGGGAKERKTPSTNAYAEHSRTGEYNAVSASHELAAPPSHSSTRSAYSPTYSYSPSLSYSRSMSRSSSTSISTTSSRQSYPVSPPPLPSPASSVCFPYTPRNRLSPLFTQLGYSPEPSPSPSPVPSPRSPKYARLHSYRDLIAPSRSRSACADHEA